MHSVIKFWLSSDTDTKATKQPARPAQDPSEAPPTRKQASRTTEHPHAWNDFKKVNAIRMFTVVLKICLFSLAEVLIASINIVKERNSFSDHE